LLFSLLPGHIPAGAADKPSGGKEHHHQTTAAWLTNYLKLHLLHLSLSLSLFSLLSCFSLLCLVCVCCVGVSLICAKQEVNQPVQDKSPFNATAGIKNHTIRYYTHTHKPSHTHTLKLFVCDVCASWWKYKNVCVFVCEFVALVLI